MLNLNCFLTLTSFLDVLGTDQEGMRSQNGILNLISFSGLLGSDEEGMTK